MKKRLDIKCRNKQNPRGHIPRGFCGTDVHNQPKIHIEIRLKTHIFPRTFADIASLCYDDSTRF